MSDPNNMPIDDGDRTAGGGIIDPRTDGTTGSGGDGGTTQDNLSILMDDEDDLGETGQGNDEVRQTGVNEVVNGRFGSDVD